MHTGFGAHAGEEALEQYAMGSLAEEKLAEVEEHLLVCAHCQERLQELDHFVTAMRRVAPRLRSSPERVRGGLWSSLFPFPMSPRLAWAGGLAVLALLIVVARPWLAGGPGAPVPVALTLMRGPENSNGATAPAGKPLQLEAGVADVGGLDRYTLEIVNAAGKPVYTSPVVPEKDKVRLTTPRGYPAGVYFVRLYAPPGELLREFRLTVR